MRVLRAFPRVRVVGLLVTVLCVGAAVLGPVEAAQARHAGKAHRSAGGQCFGAAAMDPGKSCPAPKGEPVPTPAQAPNDLSAAYDVRANGLDCWSKAPSFPRNTCHFGAKHGRIRVVLAGNSHAGEWLPALQRIAKHRRWRITTELASRCAMSDVLQAFPAVSDRHSCRSWARHAATRVRHERPDLIVFSNRMSLPADGHDLADSVRPYAAGMARLFRKWKGIPVVLIRDTPAPGDGGISVPRCLEAHPDDYAACDGQRSVWIPADPGVLAAQRVDNVRVANLNNHICGPQICSAVVGGVTAYVDGSHLSATFSRTLAPYLRPALLAGLRHKPKG